jgi:hypothetical protein
VLWHAHGIAQQTLADLLSTLTIVVTDLSGRQLAGVSGNTLYLDINAAGHGWFVDSTPLEHSEFSLFDGEDDWLAEAGSAAFGEVDLLTTVLHELGHLLGHDHEEHGAMQETLGAGRRRLGL